MDAILQDLRFALRALRKSPGFTIVAVLTLGFGIGGNTAMFSFVRGYLMRPLPVKEPDQLLVLAARDSHIELPHGLSYLDYLDYRGLEDVFEDVIARAEWPVALSWNHGGNAERLWVEMVTGNYFEVLGMRAARGRTFLAGEERAPVLVLTWDCWQRRFGGDPGVLGSTVSLNGRAFTVIGVGPRGFHGSQVDMVSEAFAPLLLLDRIRPGAPAVLEDRSAHVLRPIARLRAGATVEQARAAAEVLSGQLARQYPKTNGDVRVMVVRETQARPEVQVADLAPRAAAFVMGCVGFVLLIACANIANLLLVRANRRQREVAIRSALGASRWRVVRLLLTESLVLALAGGAAGAVLVVWAGELLPVTNTAGAEFPIRVEVSVAPDLTVFVFAFAVSLIAGVVCGLAPALQARPDVAQWLKGAARLSGGGHKPRRLSGALVVAEVALSLVLLLTATAFIQGARELRNVDLGLDIRNVQLLSVDLSSVDSAYSREFPKRLIESVRALPGIRSAALAQAVPFHTSAGFRIYTDEQAPSLDTPLSILGNVVSPGYFRTLRMPLLAGREFDERDDESAPNRAVVNQALARRLWPHAASPRDALGRKVRLAGGAELEVIGVVRTAKYVFPNEDPRPYLYTALAQNLGPAVSLHVRTARSPADVAAALREQVRRLNPGLPMFGVKTLEEHVYGSYLFRALLNGGSLSGLFGLLGLLLAAIGIFGVIANSVNQRTREIGIRMAVGAERRDVVGMVVRQGMALVLAGVAIGLAGAWGAVRLTRLLLRTEAGDPLVFAAVTLALSAVALLACYVPSRRAARVDPMAALRWE
jgi:predicted permease